MKGLLTLLFCSAMAALAADAQKSTRVALAPFTCTQNSYRAGLWAQDFADLLQVELSRESNLEWVERSKLQEADKELQLAAAGLADNSSALAYGRWQKADWLLTGKFSRNGSNDHVLLLEVVDVRHADVLAASTIEFPGSSAKSVKDLAAQVGRAADEGKKMLSHAATQWREKQAKTPVALLFAHAASLMHARPIHITFQQEFPERLRQALETNKSVYLVTFPKARASTEENSLAVRGLAEGDPDRWKNGKEWFVWAMCESRGGHVRGIYTNFHDLSLQLLSPHGQVFSVTNYGLMEAQLRGAFDKAIAEMVAVVLKSRETQSAGKKVDAQLVMQLLARADAIPGESPSGFLGNDFETRERFLRFRRVLDTACFIDPSNEAAQLHWLFALAKPPISHRAGKTLEGDFQTRWKANEAWGRYIDQFGVKSTLPPITNASHANLASIPSPPLRAIMAAYEVLEVLHSGSPDYYGFPNDVNGPVAETWQKQTANDFIHRAKAAAGLPEVKPVLTHLLYLGLEKFRDPASIVGLIEAVCPSNPEAAFPLSDEMKAQIAKAYQSIGRAGAGQRFIAGKPTAPAPAAITTIKLPRLKQATQDVANIFQMPSLDLYPKLQRLEPHSIRFPTNSQITSVPAIHLSGGRAWMIAHGNDQVMVSSDDEAGSVSLQTNRLYRFDGAALAMPLAERTSGPLNSLAGNQSVLWVTGAKPFRIDLASGKIQFVPAPHAETFSAALIADNPLVVTYDSALLSWDNGQWRRFPMQHFPIGGSLRKVAVGSGGVLYYTGALLHSDNSLTNWWNFQESFSDSPHLGLPLVNVVIPDGSGFWVGSHAGLHHVDPSKNQVSNWYIPKDFKGAQSVHGSIEPYRNQEAKIGRKVSLMQPTSRIRSVPSALAADATHLYVGLNDFTILVFDKGSKQWVNRVRTFSWIYSMAVDETYVWVGGHYGSSFGPLFRFEKKHLLDVPQTEWLPDRPTEHEINAKISQWSPLDQAKFFFFSGEYEKAALLLEPICALGMHPEAFLLAGYASEFSTPDKTDDATRRFQSVLSMVPTNSLLAAEARSSIDRLVIQQARQRLKKYDKSGDGQFDATEVVQLWADPNYIRGPLKRFDLNQSGTLEKNELRAFDLDGDGLLMDETFLCDLNHDEKFDAEELELLKRVSRAMAEQLVERLDGSRDQLLDHIELKDFVRVVGDTSPPKLQFFYPGDLAHLLSRYDDNQDGRISATELTDYFSKPHGPQSHLFYFHRGVKTPLKSYDANSNGSWDDHEVHKRMAELAQKASNRLGENGKSADGQADLDGVAKLWSDPNYFRARFRQFDLNQDGALDNGELCAFDLDGDGIFSAETFLCDLNRDEKFDTEELELLKRVFVALADKMLQVLDTNRDKLLDETEMKDFVTVPGNSSPGKLGFRFRGTLDDFRSRHDQNKDGKISAPELGSYFSDPYAKMQHPSFFNRSLRGAPKSYDINDNGLWDDTEIRQRMNDLVRKVVAAQKK